VILKVLQIISQKGDSVNLEVVTLSNTDVQSIKEDIKEVIKEVKELSQNFNDFRVLIVGDYVKKEEFNDHIKTENSNRWKMGTLMFGICTFVFGVYQWIVNIFRGGTN